MASATYEIIAQLMRYVFVLLGFGMLFIIYRMMRRESRAYEKELEKLPDSGKVGELLDIDTGERFPLPREGVLGSGSRSDVRISRIYKGKTADIVFEDGKGVKITPFYGREVLLDGKAIHKSSYALHGTLLEIGSRRLRVRLFAGLNVPQRAVFMEESQGAFDEEPEYTFDGEEDLFSWDGTEGALDDPSNAQYNVPWLQEAEPGDAQTMFYSFPPYGENTDFPDEIPDEPDVDPFEEE